MTPPPTSRPLRVLVCGGRAFADQGAVDAALDQLLRSYAPGIEVLIHGGARGADELARRWAVQAGVPHLAFEARWKLYGRQAGPVRNEQMLVEGRPDLVIAFPGGIGTADMVARARAAGVLVVNGMLPLKVRLEGPGA